MKPTHNLLRVLAILFIISLVILSAQIAAQVINTGPNPPSTPTITPEPGFVVDIPQKAFLKNYVVVSAQAAPGTKCELMFVPASGEIQKMDAVADENGKCTWRWKLEESQGKGNGRLIFTIGGKSETHFIEIQSGL